MSHELIKLDGSDGEGGGQVLRTALAMSTVTKKSMIIENIRANRPNAGLARQHLAGLHLIRDICQATVSGDHIGSKCVKFEPGEIQHGEYSLDVGTAGSVTLVLQTVLPTLASVEGKSTITMRGGTDVKWAPPVDYYKMMLFPILKSMGLECTIEVETRGYFPKGGGKITFRIISKGHMEPLKLDAFSDVQKITGVVNITSLPVKIAERVKDSALEALSEDLRKLADISIEHKDRGPSQGVGIVLAATDGKGILGADCLGERGKPAEKVGQDAVRELMVEIEGGASVDLHLSDQLLPFLALAGGSYSARKLTGHAGTNVKTIEKFLGPVIEVEESERVRFKASK
ncbi:MAG: RNA 3'-terminal phosphate cyclase [Thermoplasmata archaeon]|nr:RNA 3'-terminal phosphate cyclase [Thermoplasmata archaeon]